ncbi:FAD-dependent oxidoreductase [Paraburkholderia sp. BL10I2N1]|uniref:FAD-dependent oxidoreductase n=1 Tax=Paraburkholderia sp. BL10I2N1 TaxID=1938796 RepID=UPI0010D6365B|nr:FAD-dependent oxidoreductase [Paraburkholderia sp. BL10I2N1]TDN61962.1 FAD binding domain-containing protein [Paraburkholderia sp. BL10I2N1]
MDTSDILECDLLVIGAGMAGLSAAARAAEGGAKVVVIDKAKDIGGSAIISGGFVWTVPSTRKMRYVGNGDPALGAVVVDGYSDAIVWLRSRDVQMSGPHNVMYGRGYQIDIIGHLRSCVASVEHAGGVVVPETVTERLVTDEHGRVIGADTTHRDGAVRVLANNTIIATGGFQGSADLRAEYIHPHARSIPLRSNPCSTGDGLQLGTAVGGHLSDGHNPGFYGHLLCYPASLDHPSKFAVLTQYHSEFSVLLNKQGQRFCDESLGDHLNAQETLTRTDALALLVWDQRIEEEYVMKAFVEGIPPVDKLAVALAQGAKGALCPTLDDVARHADEWGFDGAAGRATLERYSAVVRSAPETLHPCIEGALLPNDKPPYRALVVQPAITFTHAGLAADDRARALDSRGQPIPGLLVAGADVGNTFRRGYAGGLAAALTFGLRAAQTATGDR